MTTGRSDNSLHGAMHDKACEWIARLRADDVSEADRQDFALWLAANPAHRAAMDEMLDLWEDLEVLVGREDSAAPLEPAGHGRRRRRPGRDRQPGRRW